MEEQNCNGIESTNLNSNQHDPYIPGEALTQNNNNNNNNVSGNDNVFDGVRFGSVSDSMTVTKIEGTGSGSGQVVVKRGRGRPRKYGLNRTTPPSVPPGFIPIENTPKRGRGRPRGSGKLQILASIGGFVAETAGGSFTPHVLTVKTGEDVVSRIISFFHKGPRAVCVLSATGAVSSVVIRQSGASGSTMRFQGHFEILSLSGSCTYTSGADGAHRENGMLSISLAQTDGRVFGGSIESPLIAAGPIQLVMGSFKQNISNQIKKRQLLESSNTPNMLANPDSERETPKVPKLTEGEKSCPSPKSGLGPTPTTNGTIENVNPPITNGVIDNVTPEDHNIHSASVNGVDLECQTLQPVTDQITCADVDASVT